MQDPHDAQDCLPGRRASVALAVTAADTAIALRSGDVPVLASPRVVALAEQAAVLALDGALPPERTSVGAWVELEHREPTRVGETVTAEAVLLGVHGRRLEFSVSVVDEAGTEVAHLRHRRVMVNRARFSGGSGGHDDADAHTDGRGAETGDEAPPQAADDRASR